MWRGGTHEAGAMTADEPELGRIQNDDPDAPLYAPMTPSGVLLCYACRDSQQCGMGIGSESIDADDVVVSEIVCGRSHEGGPDVAQGSWVAGVLNEVVGHVVLLRDEFVVTGTLKVVFSRPTPVQVPLIARASVSGREGRKVFVTAQLQLAETGATLATAEAILIRRPQEHFDQNAQWLAAQRPQHDSTPTTR